MNSRNIAAAEGFETEERINDTAVESSAASTVIAKSSDRLSDLLRGSADWERQIRWIHRQFMNRNEQLLLGSQVYIGTATHRRHFLVSCAHLLMRQSFRVFDRHDSPLGELCRSNV
jgi:hypothetical protein